MGIHLVLKQKEYAIRFLLTQASSQFRVVAELVYADKPDEVVKHEHMRSPMCNIFLCV